MGLVGSFSRACAALLAVRCDSEDTNAEMPRCSAVCAAAGSWSVSSRAPLELQRRQSMTRQTVYRRPVFEMTRRQFDGVAAYSTCRSTRATGCSIRRARWPPPVRYIGTRAASPCSRGYRVESLTRGPAGAHRENGRSISRPQPLKNSFPINPFEFACANRVRNGRSDRCLV
jgi:hypothetical protein